MKNKYKIILIICVIIGICSILVGSIAYYRIVVEGNIKASTGNAVFVLKDENSNVWNNKEINLGKVNPGDSGEFTVTMDASGSTVDMYATLEIERNTLPTNLKFYTTSDHKSELHKYYSFLEKSGTSSETLTIYWYWNPYISDEEDSKFINKESIEANIRVSAVQISEYAMMKNGVSYVPSTHTYNGTEFWSDDYRPYIRMINFSNDLSNLPENCNDTNLCFDVSNSSSQIRKVYAYLVDSGLKDSNNSGQSLYNLYIVSGAPIFAPVDCSFMFSNFVNLEILNFNNNFNTSLTTSMKAMFMPVQVGSAGERSSHTGSRIMLLANEEDETIDYGFDLENKIVKLDLSDFNTSKVTSMTGMFSRCFNLINLDLNSFNTANVTSMNGMFYGCSSLTSLNLGSLNTSNVTSMDSMFYNCSSLTSLDLSSFNTANVTNMYKMFSECFELINLNLSSFNTSKVTNMGYMFWNCWSLMSLDLSIFNTSKVTDMSNMFSDCKSLIRLDISGFNTSNVTDMRYMFTRCSSLTSLDLSSFNTSNVTNMKALFLDCPKITTTLNIMNPNMTSYDYMINQTATADGALVTLNYTADTSSLVDSIISSASSGCHVVKGKQI